MEETAKKAKTANSVQLPLHFSKKYLFYTLFPNRSYQAWILRRYVFTDEALETLGITADEYRRIKTFTFQQCHKIRLLLQHHSHEGTNSI